MKKTILTAGILCAMLSSAFAERTITISIQGTQKEGTTTSSTYNADGSVTLSATCDATYMECARSTFTVSGMATAPSLGDAVHFETFGSEGSVRESFYGRYVSDRLTEFKEGRQYDLTLTDLSIK